MTLMRILDGLSPKATPGDHVTDNSSKPLERYTVTRWF